MSTLDRSVSRATRSEQATDHSDQTIANTQTGDYTLALDDAGRVVEMNAASSKTITVPPNSAVAFPVETVVRLLRYGAGALVVAPGAGVTIDSRDGLLAVSPQYGVAVLRKRATDEWVLSGDLA